MSSKENIEKMPNGNGNKKESKSFK